MKSFKRILLFVSFFIFIISASVLAEMNDYYARPPFLQLDSYSNLMMALDYSGSMSWDANSDFGYFKDNESYSEVNGVYEIVATGGTLGSVLNQDHMTRVDILRLVLTGGATPGVCSYTGSNDCDIYDADQGGCEDNYLCRWRNNNCRDRNRTSCGDITDKTSCLTNALCDTWAQSPSISTYDGTTIKTTDTTNYNSDTENVEGVLQKIGYLSTKPRIGGKFFQGSSVDTIDASYDYAALITKINTMDPNDGTNTEHALEEILDIYSNDDNSFDAYEFVIDGADTEVACATNYTLLVTDGAWNTGGEPVGTVDDMWKGGTADLDPNMDYEQRSELFALAMYTDDDTKKIMKHFAIAGGYVDKDGDGRPCGYTDATYLPDTGGSSGTPDSVPTACDEWDYDNNTNGDGLPDNYFFGNSVEALELAITKVFTEILAETSAGSSVSVLSDNTKEGAIMAQAVFHPQRQKGAALLSWIGQLHTYWFYNTAQNLDSGSIGVQNVREDNAQPYATLNVHSPSDRILNFGVDQNSGKLFIDRYTSDDNGTIDTLVDRVYDLDDLNSLWEAGQVLADRDISADPRQIYVVNNPSISSQIVTTSDTNSLTAIDNIDVATFGNIAEVNCLDNSSANLISFLKGNFLTGTSEACRTREFDDSGTTKTWRLGDIIYSTPQIAMYPDYNVVIAGANDGMLHAFNAGKISDNVSDNTTQVVKLESGGTYALGEEVWSFIPHHAKPYLKYLADPGYEHIYSVDGTPFIFDYNGKKIALVGMRMGGATGCIDATCVNPPIETCADTSSDSCVGLSSYFALDITDIENPEFLFEFTDQYLGFTFSGPGIIHYEGHDYLMFLSGPTNYDAMSGQDLRIYVLEMDSTTYKPISKTVITGATHSALSSLNLSFGGKLYSTGIMDESNPDNTKLLYFGLNQNNGINWQGNILAIKIDDTNPLDWDIETVFNQGTSPITTKIEHMKCFDMDYVYFGTGRWFFKTDEIGQNVNDVEEMYGVRVDSCLDGGVCNANAAHNTNDACSDIDQNVQNSAWQKDLLPKDTDYMKERVISDPAPFEAANIVFISSTQPSGDVCDFGGRSRMWALNCATGASFSNADCSGYTSSDFTNSVYLHLSKGNIEEMDSGDFSSEGASDWFVGITPETPPIIPPGYSGGAVTGTSRLLFWIER